jgi:hypothetical protein
MPRKSIANVMKKSSSSPPSTSPHISPPGKTPPSSPPNSVTNILLQNIKTKQISDNQISSQSPKAAKTSPKAARTSPQAARTSPQATRTSPQAARTSPQAARTSTKQISPKLINTGIKTISKTVKDNLNKDISKGQCIDLVEQLKKINKHNINKKNPPIIKNPITNRDLKFDGDTTLGLLSNCYNKYKNDIPNLLDVIDEHNLIISNTIKPTSSKHIAVQPTTTMQTNTTQNISKHLDIVKRNLLEEYQKSCKNLELKTSFTYIIRSCKCALASTASSTME